MESDIIKNRRDWQELERLVKRARRRIRKMTPEELSRLDALYRQTSVYLAQVATRTRDQALLQYLNDLCAAAHSVIYLPPRKPAVKRIVDFVLTGFPRAFSRTWRYHAWAGGLLLFGIFLGYLAVARDSSAAYSLLPAGETRQLGSTRQQLLDMLRHGRDYGGGMKFFFTSFLFSHNFKVGLLSLASGMLAGAPTVLLTVYNGMILGAFTAVHHEHSIYIEYWAWILPHGIAELTAIVICGGIGLQLGRAVVCPGLISRTESLLQAGKEAVRLITGVVLLLLFAAVVEGFLRQSDISSFWRFFFAGVALLFWSSYFATGFSRRQRGRDRSKSARESRLPRQVDSL